MTPNRWAEIFHGTDGPRSEVFMVGYPTTEEALAGEGTEARSEEPGSFVVPRKRAKRVIELMEEARR